MPDLRRMIDHLARDAKVFKIFLTRDVREMGHLLLRKIVGKRAGERSRLFHTSRNSPSIDFLRKDHRRMSSELRVITNVR